MASKLSISLTPEDLAWIDSIIERGEATTRSAAVQAALRLHRDSVVERQLVAQFDEAMQEDADGTDVWDATAGDNL